MQIVIPMSGTGDRFLRAGYTSPKPLIEVDGKPIVEHVVGLFPGETNILFICNADHLRDTRMRATLQRIAPDGRIVAIAPHKRGPVHTVLEAADHIDDRDRVIVNYCDFSAYWDYPAFVDEVTRTACDGAITAYRGFHPHSLGPNLYAYMREQDGDLLEIKEKGCFTPDRLQEFASAGTYYFSSGALMKRYFRESIARGDSTSGEYYVSLVYNLLVRDGLRVRIVDLEHFLQWGTPEDLAEYTYWSEAFARLRTRESEPKHDGETWRGVTAILPAAGEGHRFRSAGYAQPKPLVPVLGRPMMEQAVGTLPPVGRALVLTRRELADLVPPLIQPALSRVEGPWSADLVVRAVDAPTEGQACTCLLARPDVPDDTPILIAACDTGLLYDRARLDRLVSDPRVDAIVFTFRGYAPAARRPQMYGWVSTDGDRVTGVSTKVPTSVRPIADHAVSGAFYFRRAGDFYEAAHRLIARDRRVNGEFYVDECINDAVQMGLHVVWFEIDKYLCWGTPDELKTFEYWAEYFRKTGERQG